MSDAVTKNIVWMMDEALAEVHPYDWSKAISLEGELVDLIGSPEMSHVVVHPLDSLRRLAPLLKDEKFSCVLDLTGWMTPIIREMFPSVWIENRLALSRVRAVSSPRLETTGYMLNLSLDEIGDLSRGLDLSRPLIVDDVGFSGWTSIKVMDLWGIDPEVATHAFLIANVGELGQSPGAVGSLESVGSRVLYGHALCTPEEDGWHLKDLHKHPNLREAFNLSMVLQRTVSELGADSEEVTRFFRQEEVLDILFPERFTSSEILRMTNEGRFVLLNEELSFSEGVFHARNPFLWASLYLRDHLDIERLVMNEGRVLATITELRSLSLDPEGRVEAQRELGREVSRMCRRGVEGTISSRERRRR